VLTARAPLPLGGGQRHARAVLSPLVPTVGTRVASSTSSTPGEDVTVSNRILTDIRAPRLLDGTEPGRYPAQHALPEQQQITVLELDTLS
jgi:hypothetical protein